MIIYKNPSIIEIHNQDDRIEGLRKFLTYRDTAAVYETQRFKKNVWAFNKLGAEAFYEKLEDIKKLENKCLLKEQDGIYYTLAGLYKEVSDFLKDTEVKYDFNIPEPKFIKWVNKQPVPMRYYQSDSVDKLLEARHAAIEAVTGSGKTRIMLELIKRLGLKTVVVCPSVAIAVQTYEYINSNFGSQYVCLYGGKKRKFDKQIIVAVDESLAKVKKDSPAYKSFQETKVLICDESHIAAINIMEYICTDLLRSAPYRFFISATQVRNDGSEMKLHGMIGPIVYKYGAKQAIEEGYLARPTFFIKKVSSNSNFYSDDVLKMMAKHFYQNAELHKDAAELANKSVEYLDQQVLILIDHIEQFKLLYPYLRHETGFCYGGIYKDSLKNLPAKYHKIPTKTTVDRFNEGKYRILVGTGCISTGVDMPPVNHLIMLQGGKSEIKIKQAIGRGTRIISGKKMEFSVTDYMVTECPVLERHTYERIKLYKSIYDDVRFVD